MRPAQAVTRSAAGLFASQKIRISIPKSLKPVSTGESIRIRATQSVVTEYEVVLPDSDRAKKLSRKEKEVRRKRRKAEKSARKRNRR